MLIKKTVKAKAKATKAVIGTGCLRAFSVC